MAKFNSILTETGDKLIAKRANNISTEVKDNFEEELRLVNKRIRDLENEVVSMEDLSVRNTQTLIVGENLNVKNWVKRRIDIALQLEDLRFEQKKINELLEEYFSEEGE